MSFVSVVKRGAKCVGMWFVQHGETILTVGAIGSGVGAVAYAVKATKETRELDDNYAQEMKEVEKLPKSEQIKTTISYGKEYVKAYWPVAALGATSVVCILGVKKLASKKLATALLAYDGLSATFQEYRGRVRDYVGKEIEQKLCYGFDDNDTVTYQVEDRDTGEIKDVKAQKLKLKEGMKDYTGYSPFAKFYGEEGISNASGNVLYDAAKLTTYQNEANRKLDANGYLMLNDVYGALGMPGSRMGQTRIGWLSQSFVEKYPEFARGRKIDTHVDFSPTTLACYHPEANEWIEGRNPTILLDFNCYDISGALNSGYLIPEF